MRASVSRSNPPRIERLRELLEYDDTSPSGLRWRRRQGRQGAGTVAGAMTKRRNSWYWEIRIDGCRTYVHRVVWALATGNWPQLQIDHIDGDCNIIANLREATQQQNSANMRLRPHQNTSGVKGVYWSKQTKKWVANIHVNGKTRYLGSFSSKYKAHHAYYTAAKEAWDEFARPA